MSSSNQSAASSVPVISANEQLSWLLQQYIVTRRWYRAKARTISRLEIHDIVPVTGTEASIVIARLAYTDGEVDFYIIPLSSASSGIGNPSSAEVVGEVSVPGSNNRTVVSALEDPRFTGALLSAMACETTFHGQHGAFIASRTSAFDRRCSDAEPPLQAKVSRAEQSNSSIIFEDRYILKLFRKVEPGINPDIEIGAFLTEHRFKNTPAVLGTLAYAQGENEHMYAGILQAFVRNEGDAWKFTLDNLAGFFAWAAAENRPAPHAKSMHPLHLAETDRPATVAEYIGSYLDSAKLLGERTAEMHAVLSSDAQHPDFRPMPFSADDAALLHRQLLHESDATYSVLRCKRDSLDQVSAKLANELLGKETQVRKCLASLPHAPVKAMRIRHHGDYHLGQVLVANGDFMIIDFEGEPARPIASRRDKALALRDVAGMVRSFQYAAYAGLPAAGGVTHANRHALESWADYWSAWVSAAYLCGYFERAGKAVFAPADAKERRALLDAFLLQKALYEVSYELNNRPDWVQIPLRGILNLLN